MGTKKSDCVAMFPESIEKVQKSMPKETDLSEIALRLAPEYKDTDFVRIKRTGDVCR